MTLDEAIKHAEEVAELNEWFDKNCLESMKCRECAEEHRQLAEWLKDYKRLLEQEPCEDAISRQAVIDGINEYFHDEYYQRTSIQECRDCLIEDVIKDMPSVKPQKPKTGYWIEVIDEIDSLGNKTWHHKCSICGNEDSGWGIYKYCPNCGARMVEPQESEDKK